MFRYLEGRDEQDADLCELVPLQEFFAPPDRTIVDLAVEMTLRQSFATRIIEHE
jgi:hypothetical protein